MTSFSERHFTTRVRTDEKFYQVHVGRMRRRMCAFVERARSRKCRALLRRRRAMCKAENDGLHGSRCVLRSDTPRAVKPMFPPHEIASDPNCPALATAAKGPIDQPEEPLDH